MIKILKKAFSNILNGTDWLTILLEGQFYELEQLLFEKLLGLYDQIVTSFLKHISKLPKFINLQRVKAKSLGLKKLVFRPVSIQLRTGTIVKVASLYAKSTSPNYCGSRHLSHLHWNIQQGASPVYLSTITLLSVICPSFEVTWSIMKHFGIKGGYSRVRKVALALSEVCLSNRSSIQLSEKESLADKRVVIAIDGGRTRTRSYKSDLTNAGNRKFDTNWREPKMFIISTIDKDGNRQKVELPIYDSTFGDTEMIALLSDYLVKLNIDKAASIQIIADGALWIWKQVAPMLEAIGVEKDRIIETLDFYHASEHLHDLKEYLPKANRETVFKKLQNYLWKGNIKSIGRLLKKTIPDLELKDFTPYQYFVKNEHRIDYQWLRFHKWPCGSGIIESGIRRIINLRFKSPSSFWYPENVEKMILMRAIALSGRWNIMLENLFIKKII